MVRKPLAKQSKTLDTKVKTLPKSNYLIGVKYTFSINANDSLQHWEKNSLWRDRLLIQSYTKLLEPLKSYADYELYPEFSKFGRFHYHGYITFKSPKALYGYQCNYVHKLLSKAQIEIDVVNHPDSYEKYITKDEYYMKSNLPKDAPYKLTNRTPLYIIDKKKNNSLCHSFEEYGFVNNGSLDD